LSYTVQFRNWRVFWDTM